MLDLKKISSAITGNPKDAATWLFRVLFLLILIKVAFFNNSITLTEVQPISPIVPKIAVQDYKIIILERQDSTLKVIRNEKANPIDSIRDDSLAIIITEYINNRHR